MSGNLKTKFRVCLLLVTALLAASTARAGETVLLHKGPAPQRYVHETPPPGVKEVHYPGQTGNLMAWFAMPQKAGSQNVPLLVFFHGGFSFGAEDFAVTKPFLDAGFAVMTPTLRGENGNPGYFELMAGEVDDALAAIEWARKQPGIDSSRVYIFGHSVGGGISGLVAQQPEAHLRLAGGAAGLYSPKIFEAWQKIVPFDIANQEECNRRLYFSSLGRMQSPFYLYMGTEDGYSPAILNWINTQAAVDKFPFKVAPIPGDHEGMLPGAASAFAKVIQADAQAASTK
jgi:pimeloyl-ACP methyl ester carboxylesterase